MRSSLFLALISTLYNFVGLNFVLSRGTANRIVGRNRTFRRLNRILVIGNHNLIELGRLSVLLDCRIAIRGNGNRIIIGENTRLSGVELNIEDDGNLVVIGDNTTIYGKAHLACIEGTRLMIGRDCMISSDVSFRTGDSHAIVDQENRRINFSKDIIVGEHVWLGNRTTLTKGAKVPSFSVVGTGSIVTKELEGTHSIIAGVPARVLRTGINWKRDRGDAGPHAVVSEGKG